MKLAVNYSMAALKVRQQKQAPIDLFKCPAWPDVLQRAIREAPIYVHFPLRVALGNQDAINTETRQPADWRQIETMLSATNTPHVNLHLGPRPSEFPDTPRDVNDPTGIEQVAERLILDVGAVVKRFGCERVVVENLYDHSGDYLRQALLPQVIQRVVRETRCGLLLDLAHARLAALCLGMDPYDYVKHLPIQAVREIHVTGIQRFDAAWTRRLSQVQVPASIIERFAGRLSDHLPMTPPDWGFFAWAMRGIQEGQWGRPWVVTYEYGGIDSWWEAITDTEVLTNDLPNMRQLMDHSKSSLGAS